MRRSTAQPIQLAFELGCGRNSFFCGTRSRTSTLAHRGLHPFETWQILRCGAILIVRSNRLDRTRPGRRASWLIELQKHQHAHRTRGPSFPDVDEGLGRVCGGQWPPVPHATSGHNWTTGGDSERARSLRPDFSCKPVADQTGSPFKGCHAPQQSTYRRPRPDS